ncbi:MAG: ABC transporter ATP-binding protein [Methylococcales bacterium]|nr:ABC transporter ATP-binding protein [Methylococcales bacterium]
MSAVIANGLGKVYQRYAKPIDSLKELWFKEQYHEEFWALRDVSFRCEPGEVFGVVGDNGAGKSTLLKLLAGTMQQSHGELVVNGRVSAILELGSGFHPEYTGLENIKLGCALLGLNEQQTLEKIPEIIDFSELGDFVKQPVKSYSSGMFVRLAFAVVTSVDPDVLVVDEALSVGDQHFQKKSMDRMMAFKDQGKSLIFCSHSLYHVKELCKRAIWLDKGIVKMQGTSGEVIDCYNDHVRQQNRVSVPVSVSATATTTKTKDTPVAESTDSSTLTAHLTEATLLDVTVDINSKPLYRTGDRFAVKVLAHVERSIALDDVHIGIIIKRNDDVQCFGVSTVLDGKQLFHVKDRQFGVMYEIQHLDLLSGQYSLEIWLIDSTSVHVYDSMQSCCEFRVSQPNTEVGVAYFEHKWLAPV